MSTLNSTSTTVIGSTRSRPPMENPSHPYFLHPSDNPGLILVQQTLTGDNYPFWSRSMLLALNVKHKLGFINGSLPDPGPDDADLQLAWSRSNDVVVSWILNSVSPDIYSSILYTNSARDIWNQLKTRFQTSNGPRKLQLRRELANMHQDNLTVNQFFTKLKSIWDEFSNYRPLLTPCTCDSSQKIHSHYQEDFVLTFLLGLNDSFDNLRSQILLMDPIPHIDKVFSLATQEERQKLVGQNHSSDTTSSLAFVSKSSPSQQSQKRPYNQYQQPLLPTPPTFNPTYKKKDIPTCSHCNFKGHTVDKCYKLHGYPIGYKPKPKPQNSFNPNPVNNFTSNSPQNTPSQHTQNPLTPLLQSLNSEQYQHLMDLFNNHLNQPATNDNSPDTAHISCVSGPTREDDWQG